MKVLEEEKGEAIEVEEIKFDPALFRIKKLDDHLSVDEDEKVDDSNDHQQEQEMENISGLPNPDMIDWVHSNLQNELMNDHPNDDQDDDEDFDSEIEFEDDAK